MTKPPLPSPLLPITACEWVVGDFDPDGREVRICARLQMDGATRYAVTRGGWAANKDGEWDYEPMPSSRDDAYYAQHRWDAFDDAAYMAQRMAGKQR